MLEILLPRSGHAPVLVVGERGIASLLDVGVEISDGHAVGLEPHAGVPELGADAVVLDPAPDRPSAARLDSVAHPSSLEFLDHQPAG